VASVAAASVFVRLDSIARFIGGGTPSKARPEFFAGDIPWVTPKDMKSAEIWDAADHITPEAVHSSTTSLIPIGSILAVVRSGVLKHTFPIAINRVPVAINQDIKALICTPEVHPEFLMHFLRHSAPHILQCVRGTTADNIPVDELKSLRVPLPPLEEQRRIAAILDQADALRAKRREALAKTTALCEAVFLDIFGDPIYNPNGWPNTTLLGDIADIVSGITIGRPVNGKPTRDVPYLAVLNVKDRALNLQTVKRVDATEEEISRYRLQTGDLLLTEGGDPDKLGRGALWNNEIPECIHQNHIFRVRLHSNAIDPLFLCWLVGSRRGKAYFLRSAKQTTGIASINMTQLRQFPLLCPPVSLQRQFRERIAHIGTVQQHQLAFVAKLDALFASLQHRAFPGEL
jgi:type I restriction enzyme S subunit